MHGYSPHHQCGTPVPTAEIYPLLDDDAGNQSEHTCTHCGTLHWLLERSVMPAYLHNVLRSGDIELPPEEPHYLVTAAIPQAERFRQHILQYNSALLFTSLGVEINEGGGRSPTVRINGELCHRLGSLLPRCGDRPAYTQLYTYDSCEALDHRVQQSGTFDPIVMGCLQDLILTDHRWTYIFKHAMEVFEDNKCEDTSIQLTANKNQDQRRRNLPAADEVAVVIPGDRTQSHGRRDVVVHRRDGPPRRIGNGSPTYECLQYRFLFIHGEDRYHFDHRMSPSKENPLSPTYVACCIQHRQKNFSLLLRSNRLSNSTWLICGQAPNGTVSTTCDTIRVTYGHRYTWVSLTQSPTTQPRGLRTAVYSPGPIHRRPTLRETVPPRFTGSLLSSY